MASRSFNRIVGAAIHGIAGQALFVGLAAAMVAQRVLGADARA